MKDKITLLNSFVVTRVENDDNNVHACLKCVQNCAKKKKKNCTKEVSSVLIIYGMNISQCGKTI